MSPPTLLDVARSRPVLADGAMGTQLQEAGLEAGTCGELWNLERPERVGAIHRAYLAAGAEVILTNTFGGSRLALARHGLGGRAAALNRAGAEVAVDAGEAASSRAAAGAPDRPAAGKHAWVLGDIGPFGGLLAPLGETDAAKVEAAFEEQATALLEGGVDGILVETMTALEELHCALRAAQRAGAQLVVASVAFDATRVGFRTMMGETPEQAVAAMQEEGADVVGANCGSGLNMVDYTELARRYRALVPDGIVWVKANAGTPRLELADGQPAASGSSHRVVYDGTPEAMAAGVNALVDAGASVVGGCCGTTPAHIRAFARALGR
ncbi:MAG: homocysteine S-methyltransferase family protein [Gemmatimonadota bacterium]